jgi:Reverse transcriptase (RNA-dependent DNA polymerase)
VCYVKLWKNLKELGFPLRLINLIKSLCENDKSRVHWGREKIEAFNPRRGTRQGCLSSLDLFSLMAELLMRLALEGYDGEIAIGGIRLTKLRYADDIVLVAG